VTVTYDGRGGAVAVLGGGSGLSGLEDRVAAVGGILTIDSPLDAGTRLTAELPVNEETVSARAEV
jgi:signal transduction histidine kinase